MPTTYATFLPMNAADFRSEPEATWREHATWEITERVKGLGYTPTAHPVAFDWYEMTEIEALSAAGHWPQWAFKAGDIMMCTRIEIAEDVPADVRLGVRSGA